MTDTNGNPIKRAPTNIWKPAFLKSLAMTGNVTVAAAAAGIDRVAAYKSRKRSTKFARQWDEALEQATDLLEGEARRRAFNGVKKPVHYKGERVDTIKEYSDTLLIFLLKAHRPHKFRENVAVEHSGQVDGSAPAPVVRVEFITADNADLEDGTVTEVADADTGGIDPGPPPPPPGDAP